MLHLTITRPDLRSARIELSGELDRSGVDAVARLTTALTPELRRVVVDLRDLGFVDLGGWRALERVCDDLSERGVTAVVEGLPASADRVRSLIDRLREAS
ncbi:MAG: STAS domain-containing protein [Acidimicrobiales bacterium]